MILLIVDSFQCHLLKMVFLVIIYTKNAFGKILKRGTAISEMEI